MKRNIYFTASSSPSHTQHTPEIDPYERHAHNWREPKAKRLEKKKKFVLDLIYGGIRGTGWLVVAHSRVHLSSGDRVMQGLGNQRIVWLVSRRYWAALVSTLLTVGLTRRTQVSSSRLCSRMRSWNGSSKIGLSRSRQEVSPAWHIERGLVGVSFRATCLFFLFNLSVKIVILSEPFLPGD